jgi:cell division protein FtsZ
MSINIVIPESFDMKPKIAVFGVGGAGCNAVNNMISTSLEGVEFWVANTDAQALEHSLTHNRIQLGTNATKGLGAGSHPEVGKQAAEESLEEVAGVLESSNMVFITAGMGGGTGTGAAPVIAKAAKERGILTVGVVTKPFHFEGARRMKVAELGLEELNKYVDTLIVIPNQNLFRIANEHTTFADAFKLADDVLHSGVRGITDLITMPGLINLDFADIRTVMSEMGKAMMGTGEADGDDRAVMAAEKAISNPLLDNSSMKGARGVLINITGGSDMTLFQVDAAANRIREEVDPNANIIFGSAYNPNLDGKVRVSVVATGIDGRGVPLNAASAIHGVSNAVDIQSHIRDELTAVNDIRPIPKESDADEEDTFIAPAPVEGHTFAGSANAEPTIGQSNSSGTTSITVDLPNLDEKNIKITASEPVVNENVNLRKNKEDFFDIPSFIRKKIKF